MIGVCCLNGTTWVPAIKYKAKEKAKLKLRFYMHFSVFESWWSEFNHFYVVQNREVTYFLDETCEWKYFVNNQSENTQKNQLMKYSVSNQSVVSKSMILKKIKKILNTIVAVVAPIILIISTIITIIEPSIICCTYNCIYNYYCTYNCRHNCTYNSIIVPIMWV